MRVTKFLVNDVVELRTYTYNYVYSLLWVEQTELYDKG